MAMPQHPDTPHPDPRSTAFGELCRRQTVTATVAHIRGHLDHRLDDLAIYAARLPSPDAGECRDIIRECREALERAAAAVLATTAGR